MLSRPTKRSALLACAVAAFASLGVSASAHASTASAVVSGGSLSFINSTPGDVAFPGVTLNGTDQTKTKTQAFDVNDASGSNAGWAITATSTTFTASGHTLSNTATTIPAAPSSVCDASSTCTLATNAISYPYALPAGTTAPTATKMFNAGTNSGQGAQTVTPTWQLAIPSTTWAGGAGSPYTSTWTFTLVSGP